MDGEGSLCNAKRPTLSGEIFVDDSVDWLSNLPEDLVTQIMSFLPMEDAIRTDALSTTWKYRWTKMTHLEIYDYCIYSKKMFKKDQFLIYLERVLSLLGNQEIKSFSLECLRKYDTARVQGWITSLIRRQVKKIRISCSLKGPLVFPMCALDCKTLKEIDLVLTCTFKVPTSCCFLSLRILSLSGISFQNMGFPASRVVTISFPLLQELRLQGCSWENVKEVTIEAPVLKNFNFADYEYMYEPKHIWPYDCTLTIQGSMLSKFNCGSHSYVLIRLGKRLSVTDASIELSYFHFFREYTMGYLTCALLLQLSTLKSLTLSRNTILALSRPKNLSARLPQLYCALHLTITEGTPEISAAFITLLGCLPRLESLTIIRGTLSPKAGPVPGFNNDCPLPHLKQVSFLSIYGWNDELELAKFIMKNAESLEEITFIARGSQKDRERKLKGTKEELLNYPRASSQAIIKFVEIAELS